VHSAHGAVALTYARRRWFSIPLALALLLSLLSYSFLSRLHWSRPVLTLLWYVPVFGALLGAHLKQQFTISGAPVVPGFQEAHLRIAGLLSLVFVVVLPSLVHFLHGDLHGDLGHWGCVQTVYLSAFAITATASYFLPLFTLIFVPTGVLVFTFFPFTETGAAFLGGLVFPVLAVASSVTVLYLLQNRLRTLNEEAWEWQWRPRLDVRSFQQTQAWWATPSESRALGWRVFDRLSMRRAMDAHVFDPGPIGPSPWALARRLCGWNYSFLYIFRLFGFSSG